MRRHARVAQRGDPGLARRSFGAGDAPRCRMLMIRMPHPQRQDGYARPAGEDHREDGTAHAGLDFGGDMRRPIGEFRKRVQREGCRIRSREAFECLADHGALVAIGRSRASLKVTSLSVLSAQSRRIGLAMCSALSRSGPGIRWRPAVGCCRTNRTAEQAPGQEVDVLLRRCAVGAPECGDAAAHRRIEGLRHCGKKIRLAQVVEPVISSLADKIPNMARRVVRRQELTQYVCGWHLFQPPRPRSASAGRIGSDFFRCLCDLLKRGASPGNATLWRTFPACIVQAKVPDRHPQVQPGRTL